MPTGIEIAGLVIASTGMGGSVVSRVANFTRKGSAQKTYDEVAHQYTQLKDLREDEVIGQFLSEKDKEHLDKAIEDIAFDLMDLQLTLHELRGVAYYKITTYPVRWMRFHDQVSVIFKQIVEVNLDIRQRSTQARELIRGESMEQGTHTLSGSTPPPSSDGKSATVDQGAASGDSLNQKIVDAMASSAATALRASLEGGVRTCPLVSAKSSSANASSGSKSTIENGFKPGLSWQLSPKSSSDPPSVSKTDDIELKGWDKEVD